MLKLNKIIKVIIVEKGCVLVLIATIRVADECCRVIHLPLFFVPTMARNFRSTSLLRRVGI